MAFPTPAAAGLRLNCMCGTRAEWRIVVRRRVLLPVRRHFVPGPRFHRCDDCLAGMLSRTQSMGTRGRAPVVIVEPVRSA